MKIWKWIMCFSNYETWENVRIIFLSAVCSNKRLDFFFLGASNLLLYFVSMLEGKCVFQVVNSSHYSAGKRCCFCTAFQQIAPLIMKGLAPEWCLRFSRAFKSGFHGSFSGMSEPRSAEIQWARRAGGELAGCSTECWPQGQSWPCLLKSCMLIHLMGLLWESIWLRISSQMAFSLVSSRLALSWVTSRGLKEGISQKLQWELISCVGGATNHMRLQEGGCSGFQRSSCINNERRAMIHSS